jgi:hypothetical protein
MAAALMTRGVSESAIEEFTTHHWITVQHENGKHPF